MSDSQLIFIGLLFVCGIFSYFAEKTGKRKYLYIIVAILSFVAGFRSLSVGKDTLGYADMFKLISKGHGELAFGLEESFKEICVFLSKFSKEPTCLFLFCAIITNFFILLRFWDYKNESSFLVMVLSYYIVFYFSTMNIMRQMCGVALAFYGTRYLERRKYFIFLCFVVLGYMFHQSILISVMFLCFEVFMWKYLNRKQKILIFLSFIIIPYAATKLASDFSKYSQYFEDFSLDFGFMLIAKMFLLIYTWHLMKKNVLCKKDADVGYQMSSVTMYYFVGIILTALGYMFQFMNRIGLPFYIFEGVYWGMVLKNNEKNGTLKIIFVLLFGYIFVSEMIGNGHRIMPFTFIF